MQVAHQDIDSSHAVIGGQQAEAFGINATAEFFDMMSSTLYSNKILAVAREYLCNANDAHIAAGRTHLPIEITLTEEKMVIRDYGYGIPHDALHSVFCVYGKSTKKNDGRQTGGFGLGSKAGFAYSPHFTVTNFHQGLKVIHAISKASNLNNGEPDRREMVRIPTTEEGLEISIPLRSKFDMDAFQRAIMEVVTWGEMNVLFNGESVKAVPISSAENNMFITQRDVPHQSQISVRYGHVIYPVPSREEYAIEHRALINSLDTLRYTYERRWNIVLQAQPNTISVTPSRETLSMTEVTIQTLRTLMRDVLPHTEMQSQVTQDMADKFARKAYEKLCAEGNPHQILTTHNPLSLLSKDTESDIVNQDTLAKAYAQRNPRLFHNTAGLRVRLDVLIENKYGRLHDLKLFRKMSDHPKKRYNTSDYCQKRIVRPLIKKLATHGILKPANLQIAPSSPHGGGHTGDFYPVTGLVFHAFELPTPLLSGVVVITYSKSAYLTEYYHDKFHRNEQRLVYVSPRSVKHKNAAVEFFKSRGFQVIDFAEEWDAKCKERAARAPRLPEIKAEKLEKPKKPEGLPTLSNLIKNDRFYCRNVLELVGHQSPSIIYNVNPEFVFKAHKLNENAWDRRFFMFGDDFGKEIVELFGDRGAVCQTTAQYDKTIKAGAKDGYLYLIEKLWEEMLTNPRIGYYLAFKKLTNSSDSTEKMRELVKMCSFNERIKSKLNLPESCNNRDMMFIKIYEHLCRIVEGHSRYWPREFKGKDSIEKLKEFLDTLVAPPELRDLDRRLKSSPLIRGLNLEEINEQLRRERKSRKPDYRLITFYEISVLTALGY